jgi:hypothetical protein
MRMRTRDRHRNILTPKQPRPGWDRPFVLALCMAARVLERPGLKIRQSRRFLSHRRPSSLRFSPLPKTPFPKKGFLPIYHCGYGGKSTALPPRPRWLRPPSVRFVDGRRLRSPLLWFASGFRASAAPPRFTQPSGSRSAPAARPVSPFRTPFTGRLFERLDGLSGIGETGLLLADSQARGGSRRWAPIKVPRCAVPSGRPARGSARERQTRRKESRA